ncbi:predicted protein [Histoplasma mississippiense (nom. inval.)]|uniref:predicted protein n=1 Tax=Ajellomyces capsulatus (strain NAm1 / WU24) TaxID=2059318 RepID=UPI000157D360|nr:predicted protein [Histoplasma mississippiense (nom. inval.)]EDN04935.1 predicted protein [Histoplasma mississippiense (nom. inval.)]
MHKTDPASTWNINYLSTVNHTSLSYAAGASTLCQQDPQCQYLAGNMNTIRKHWQNKHSWSPYPSRGRTAPQKRTAAQDEVDRSCQKVQFQQIFASRKGSHYIQIQTKETTEHTGTPDQNRASQAIDELERFYQEQQRQTSNVIQAGEHDEANPWLRRTRWPVYLTNIAPNDLVNCVQRPDDDTTCPDELAARAIGRPWGRLPVPASESSHGWATSSASRPSAQSDTRPGTPRCRHTWMRRASPSTPQYRFTPRQRKTWRVLWQVATTEGADQRHSISPDPMDEQMTEEEEEEEEKGQRDTQSEEEDKFKSTKIQMALRAGRRVAVLGRGEYGWCDAESYPPMLSRIIKVARFMVVHKALRLDANASDMLARNQASQMVGEWAVVSAMKEADYTFTGNQNEGQTFHKQNVHQGRFIITHQQRGQRALMDEEVLVEEAQRWKDQCLICASGKREFDHELYQCPHEESQEAKRWMMTVRSKIKYTQYSGCFRCGMPQSICNSWKTQRQCPYRGFLIPTVAMMMYGCHAGQMKQAWRQRLREFNVDADDQEAVIEFLGQKVEGQGMEHNRLVEMVCWLRGIYQEAERGKIELEGTEVK